mmetsp:Transcript_889/g.1231  ORF Transcript_889/g.1231 Transcript_889/m.1231 type:complete len:82 (+) Transcript_889:615-860(+)
MFLARYNHCYDENKNKYELRFLLLRPTKYEGLFFRYGIASTKRRMYRINYLRKRETLHDTAKEIKRRATGLYFIFDGCAVG